MATLIKFNIDVDFSKLADEIEEVFDDTTMLEINNTIARYCDPYVPFLNGPLSQTNVVTPYGVTYTTPYARYQYYGVDFKHTLDFHPLASAMWDQAMMRDRGEEFNAEVSRIVDRRLRQLHE